jgi:O-acetyl-ADP-ribose deacetylase (regulator of RNase III)
MRIPLSHDRALVLTTGDITRQDADAIVNAANSSLMGGGGVDGAIHRVGGPAILAECKEYRRTNPPLPPGRAVATTGGNLAARYVIHTVGPVWNGGDQGEPETLANCYRESLRVAEELKLSTIAFPSISTGAFGYPVHQAAPIAIKAVIDCIAAAQHIREVRFVLFDQRTFTAYQTASGKISVSS